jgi:uncharacterized protein (DUF885 family)
MRYVVLLSGMLLASSAWSGAERVSSEAKAGGAVVKSPTVVIADGYLVALAAYSPETGTTNDLPRTDHGALSDNSVAGIARWQAVEDRTLAQLRAATQNVRGADPDRVLRAVLRDELERNIGTRVCRLELWGVASYVNGWQASLTDLARIQPVSTELLREQALRRARAIPHYIDNEIVLLREGLREGYSSPQVRRRRSLRLPRERKVLRRSHGARCRYPYARHELRRRDQIPLRAGHALGQ